MVSNFKADRKWRYRQPLAAIYGATANKLSENSSQSYKLSVSIKSLKPLNFHSRRRVSATRRTRFSQPMSSAKLVGRGDGDGASKLCWASNFIKKSVQSTKCLKKCVKNGAVRRRKAPRNRRRRSGPCIHLHTFAKWRGGGSSGGRQRWRSLKCGELSHNDCRQET